MNYVRIVGIYLTIFWWKRKKKGKNDQHVHYADFDNIPIENSKFQLNEPQVIRSTTYALFLRVNNFVSETLTPLENIYSLLNRKKLNGRFLEILWYHVSYHLVCKAADTSSRKLTFRYAETETSRFITVLGD